MPGPLEVIVSKAFTAAFNLLSEEKKKNLLLSTNAIEVGMHTFNTAAADYNISEDEVEGAFNQLFDGLGSTAGQAIQALFWSLFKHA